MPDYLALKAEIAKAQYNGQSDQQVADTLNAPLIEATGQRVAIAEIQRVAFDRNKLLGIIAQAQQGNAAAIAAQYLFGSARFDSVDMSNPQFTATVAALKAASLLDDTDIAAVQALGMHQTSVALKVFGLPVSAADIHAVRN